MKRTHTIPLPPCVPALGPVDEKISCQLKRQLYKQIMHHPVPDTIECMLNITFPSRFLGNQKNLIMQRVELVLQDAIYLVYLAR